MRVTMVVEQLRRPVPGGIGTYARGLLQGLAVLSSPVQVELLASRVPAPDPLLSWGLPIRTVPLRSPLLTRAWERGLSRPPTGTDLVHATSFAAPRRRPGGPPQVLMVHDLAWRDLPDAYPARGRRWHERQLQRALEEVDLLLAPSERTADAARAAGAGRVEVVEHGCDHLPPADPTGAADVLQRIGVDGPYVMALGTLEPRKNLPRLLEAYAAARPLLPDPWPLVVVGPAGWGPDVRPVPGAVLAGALDAGVLSALLAGARCLAYVPLQEGFGLPAVEAMHAATPVVASPMPSTGGAALEVDPRDVGAISRALVQAGGDDRVRAELVTAGLMRARELTWERTAARHVELWAEVAARCG